MDIYVDAKPIVVKKILYDLGFDLNKGNKYFSAYRKTSNGRYHILFSHLEKQTFIDFHFDKIFHLFFIGVDYKFKPEQFFYKEIKPVFDSMKITCVTEKVNWFTRKNKAILTGLSV